MNMQIRFILLILFSFVTANFFFSQSLDKISNLNKKLNEISGLEVLNDSCFLAHNDGGNDPKLFVLNKNGDIIHEVVVTNAKNVDWEDLTRDEKNIYIADVGNNSNSRKDLCIYIITIDSLLFKKEVKAEIIEFSYEDQKDFPPNKDCFLFDCEAIAYFEDELYLFTKCRTEPYSGICNAYKLSCKKGQRKAKFLQSIQLKDRKMKLDGVTAAEIENGICYLLTYSSIEIFSCTNEKFEKIKRIKLELISQKEALCRKGKHLYIADEYYSSALKNKFYKLKIK
jgi:hypothetical protein